MNKLSIWMISVSVLLAAIKINFPSSGLDDAWGAFFLCNIIIGTWAAIDNLYREDVECLARK